MAPVQRFIIWMIIKDKYLYELYLYSLLRNNNIYIAY